MSYQTEYKINDLKLALLSLQDEVKRLRTIVKKQDQRIKLLEFPYTMSHNGLKDLKSKMNF